VQASRPSRGNRHSIWFLTPAGHTALEGWSGNSTFTARWFTAIRRPSPRLWAWFHPAQLEPGAVRPTAASRLRRKPQLCGGLHSFRHGNHGVGKVYPKPAWCKLRKTEVDCEARPADSDPDKHQQHRLGPVCGCGASWRSRLRLRGRHGFLDVSVENTQNDNGIPPYRDPRSITQAADDKVLITDGGTVVIGGVVTNTRPHVPRCRCWAVCR